MAQGRKHIPDDKTRATVKALVAYGVQQDEIAAYLEISDRSLRTHYRRELDSGTLEANAKVAERLFKTATQGEGRAAVTAQIFWLKTRARWQEVNRHEHSGPDGKPIPVASSQKVDLSRLDDDALAAIENAITSNSPGS